MLTKSKLRVEFVYDFDPSLSPWTYVSRQARMARLWGSAAMRIQARECMLPHLPQNIELTFSGLPTGSRNARAFYSRAWLATRRPAIFILAKHVAYLMWPELLAQLREKAIAVGVDHQDADPTRIALWQYDFHISSSQAGRRALEAILAEHGAEHGRRPITEVWYQSYDLRLKNVRLNAPDRLSAVYLGLPDNAALPATLSQEVTIIDVQRREDMDSAVRALGDYNFHYAVRPSPEPTLRRPYKPFTKGVTAAACQSNVLVNKQVDDAIELLTPDYPYLVESNANAQVEEGFEKAREEFGGPEWRRGLEIMQAVRERVSGPAQARQFVDIMTQMS